MKSLFERLRSRRLASAFVLLATLSVAIVAGSFAAHGVRGQEKQNSSADATPLKIVNSAVPPNEFVKIAKQVGPAVVNINTQTLPKAVRTRARDAILTAACSPIPRIRATTIRTKTSRQARAGQLPGLLQPLLRRPDSRQDGGDESGQGAASRSARDSSSIPRDTSSPTTTWSTRPTRST